MIWYPSSMHHGFELASLHWQVAARNPVAEVSTKSGDDLSIFFGMKRSVKLTNLFLDCFGLSTLIISSVNPIGSIRILMTEDSDCISSRES